MSINLEDIEIKGKIVKNKYGEDCSPFSIIIPVDVRKRMIQESRNTRSPESAIVISAVKQWLHIKD